MKIEITGEFIKIGQLIKKIGLIDTGGQIKDFLRTHKVIVNDVPAKGRSSKVFLNSTVWIDDEVYYISSDSESVN